MAVDATKLRRGIRRLGEPPTDSNPELSERAAPSTARANAGEPLSGPGVEGATPPQSPARRSTTLMPQSTEVPLQPDRAQTLPATPISPFAGVRYPDGRSRRRTGRIEQINVKVSAQFNSDLRGLADRQGLLIVEVLERALDAYLQLVAIAEESGRSVAQILNDLSHA
jgi:hypothetical protein